MVSIAGIQYEYNARQYSSNMVSRDVVFLHVGRTAYNNIDSIIQRRIPIYYCCIRYHAAAAVPVRR